MPHAKELPDLDSDEYTWAMCHSNYTGTMCMDCAETFYASGERCEKCVDAEIPHAVLLVLVATWRMSSRAWLLVLPRSPLRWPVALLLCWYGIAWAATHMRLRAVAAPCCNSSRHRRRCFCRCVTRLQAHVETGGECVRWLKCIA